MILSVVPQEGGHDHMKEQVGVTFGKSLKNEFLI